MNSHDRKDVASQVIEIIAKNAMIPVESVTLDTQIKKINLDSVGLVETIFSIEEAFDIQVPFNANIQDNSGFDTSTVRSIVQEVEKLINEKTS